MKRIMLADPMGQPFPIEVDDHTFDLIVGVAEVRGQTIAEACLQLLTEAIEQMMREDAASMEPP